MVLMAFEKISLSSQMPQLMDLQISSLHWGHMRCPLFSHWPCPTAISTFLAGTQGNLRGAKLIAFQTQLEKGSQDLDIYSPSGWGAEENSAEPRRWLTQEQLPGVVWGLDSTHGSDDEKTSPNQALACGALDWVCVKLFLSCRDGGLVGCV